MYLCSWATGAFLNTVITFKKKKQTQFVFLVALIS